MAHKMNNAFSDANNFVKLMKNPELIALGCAEYKSPISKSEYGV